MKLIIGNRNYSSWSLRAWFFLAAHELDFDVVRIPLSQPATALELEKHSPSARVPVLLDDGATIWDSLAICEYVSERYLAGAGWPGDMLARARARSVVAEMHSGFLQLRKGMPMNCRARGRRVHVDDLLQKDISRIDDIWTGLRQQSASEGPWLFGSFSIADCMYAPVVMRFQTYGIEPSQSASTYMETVLGHPAIQQWLELAAQEKEVIEEEELGAD